ncbi:MAG: ATP synthase F1 subunit delta [Deltaproteobacteria bacterium]|nr:ATP synthase F1 subunit delta [Deltaproteobacteria bacterium]
MGRIAKRYAKALLKLTGGDLQQAKKYRDSLLELKALFSLDEAARVLNSPAMPDDLKKSLLSYGLKAADAASAVNNLVDAVVDCGRVSLLPQIAGAFAQYIDEAEGLVQADVTSAVELSSEAQQQIAKAVGQLLNKKAEVTHHVDRDLLGGFVVKVGDYKVDLSLKNKLEGLAKTAVQDTFR